MQRFWVANRRGAGKGTADSKVAEDVSGNAMFPRRLFPQKKECPRIAAAEEREIVV